MIYKFEDSYPNAGASTAEIESLVTQIKQLNFPCPDLCEDYIEFLKYSNGGEFGNGIWWYQFFKADEVIINYQDYMFYEFMPDAFPFAMDGGGEFYIFDMRSDNQKIYKVRAGNIGWEDSMCIANDFNTMLSLKD